MYNLNDQGINNTNCKYRRSLNHNLRLIANYKATSHLIGIKKFKKDFLLVLERNPVNGIHFILKGKVKVFNTSINNKIQVLRLASKGDLIGLSSLNSLHYWSSAMAVESVKTYFINLKNLKTILKTNIKLSFLFVNALALYLRHYEMRQQHLSLFPASERVIDALLLTAYKFGKKTSQGLELSICTSRKEIASFANTTKEKVIRTLSNLRVKKYISIEGKKIIIKDKGALVDKLKKYCCTNNLPEEFNLCYPNFFY